MRDWIWSVSVATLAVLMPLSGSHAACRPSDLEDRWDAYAIGDDFGVAYWQRCSLRIDDRGRFRSGSSCKDHLGEESTLSSADFRLRRSCLLTGSFEQSFEEASAICDIRATLSADKQILSGVGECDDGDIFLLNMVRR
ncbi:MAG: hypothetical protein ACREJ5_23595 [Geminicoccaceae bacterium]